MITTAAYVAENVDVAVRAAVAARPNYLVSNVFRYHDTFPHPDGIPVWPDRIPDATPDMIPELVKSTEGLTASLTGTPDQALEACKQWEAAGADQVSFGFGPAEQDDALRTIRLLGEHVIPRLDPDPEHRTNRFRREAAGG